MVALLSEIDAPLAIPSNRPRQVIERINFFGRDEFREIQGYNVADSDQFLTLTDFAKDVYLEKVPPQPRKKPKRPRRERIKERVREHENYCHAGEDEEEEHFVSENPIVKNPKTQTPPPWEDLFLYALSGLLLILLLEQIFCLGVRRGVSLQKI